VRDLVQLSEGRALLHACVASSVAWHYCCSVGLAVVGMHLTRLPGIRHMTYYHSEAAAILTHRSDHLDRSGGYGEPSRRLAPMPTSDFGSVPDRPAVGPAVEVGRRDADAGQDQRHLGAVPHAVLDGVGQQEPLRIAVDLAVMGKIDLALWVQALSNRDELVIWCARRPR
jgi:hypothetical protein